MTHQELVAADFQAKAAVIDAERSYIRSQIALLEAQLKQNTVKGQELELQWSNYQESLKAAQEQVKTAESNVDKVSKKTISKA
jgi:hypothetical protein